MADYDELEYEEEFRDRDPVALAQKYRDNIMMIFERHARRRETFPANSIQHLVTAEQIIKAHKLIQTLQSLASEMWDQRPEEQRPNMPVSAYLAYQIVNDWAVLYIKRLSQEMHDADVVDRLEREFDEGRDDER